MGEMCERALIADSCSKKEAGETSIAANWVKIALAGSARSSSPSTV
jgi:hypothetical protein